MCVCIKSVHYARQPESITEKLLINVIELYLERHNESSSVGSVGDKHL